MQSTVAMLQDMVNPVLSSSEVATSEYDATDFDNNNGESMRNAKVLMVLNKADLAAGDITKKREAITSSMPTYDISCLTGEGIAELEKALAESIQSLLFPAEAGASGSAGGEGGGEARNVNVGSAMITRERHRRHVKICVSHLRRFLLGTLSMDAAAEELRYYTITYLFLLFIFYGRNCLYYCSQQTSHDGTG